VVGLSFAQRADDITHCRATSRRSAAMKLGIVLKIETVRGFDRLARDALAAMASERVGVMVARVTSPSSADSNASPRCKRRFCGYVGAHIPTIWATQVLDQLARTGRHRALRFPMRSWPRAECVMLNKDLNQ